MSTDIGSYNSFCKNIVEGDILYNLNYTNLWAEYLLVVSIITVTLNNTKTYTVLLLGMKKNGDTFEFLNQNIRLSPDNADNIHYLKPVGYCKYTLSTVISSCTINKGMETIYKNTDLWQFKEKIAVRKPRKKKYGNDGKPIIRSNNN